MIKEALEKEAESAGYAGGFDVTISIEGGAETAKRTFNPPWAWKGASASSAPAASSSP